MRVSIDIDLAALVGEMDAMPCESLDHGRVPDVHDDGPATSYAKIRCSNCGYGGHIKAYCSTFTAAIRNDCLIQCISCFGVLPASRIITIIGPVKP